MHVDIGGSEQLTALAKKLLAAADRDVVVQETGKALRAATPEIEAAIRKGTDRLPKRGGLAARVAKTRIGFKITFKRGSYAVKIFAYPNAVKDPAAIDRGRVAHPAWGRWTKPLLIQLVPKGWFSEPIKAFAPTLRKRVAAALRDALRKV